eukprot:Nk52_evm8s261 gene=Nk52_evmTU8s261
MGFSTKNFTLHSLLRRKVIPQSAYENAGLTRCMNKWQLMSYSVGATVGAGIFVTTGTILKDVAGPAVCISYLLGGIAAMLSGLCYAEFAAVTPVAGSAYTYVYTSMGEALAWFIGWNLTLEYGVCAAAVAASFSGYFASTMASVGWDVPSWLVGYKVNSVISINPLSCALVVLATLFLLTGTKNFSKVATTMTVFNMLLLIFFCFAGAVYVDTKNWTDDFAPYGVSGVMTGAGKTFFSYVGFDTVSGMSAEAKSPETDIPFALLASLSFIIVLYFMISLILGGMVPYFDINEVSPFTDAFETHGQKWATVVIGFGSLSCMTVMVTSCLLGQPRVWYAMAEDGLMYLSFKKTTKAKKVPYVGTIITGGLAGTLALLLDFDVLGDVVSAGVLFAFAVVSAGALLNRMRPNVESTEQTLRALDIYLVPTMLVWYVIGGFGFCLLVIKWNFSSLVLGLSGAVMCGIPALVLIVQFFVSKAHKRAMPFKAALFPFLPLIAIAIDLYLVAGLDNKSLYYLAVWTVLGYCIYFSFGIHHSNVAYRLSEENVSYSYSVEENQKKFSITKSTVEKVVKMDEA